MNIITFAYLISQITHVGGSRLGEAEINQIAETVKGLSREMSIETVNRLLVAIRDGRKIEAIKEYRTLTGLGLLESKNAIELHWIAPAIEAAS